MVLRLQNIYALQMAHSAMTTIILGSHVDQDGELGAACAAAHQHLSHSDTRCDNSKGLVSGDGDIDAGDGAVCITLHKSITQW